MTIANVTLNNTFDEWRVTTNQLIVKSDQLEITLNSAFSTANAALPNTSGAAFAGDLIITGNLTLSGASAVLNLL
jgi:hypothetical protein